MFNFIIIFLAFLFLVSQNVLLLNEETLILFCFIAFCWIAFNRLSESINLDFLNRSTKIEQSFTNSLSQVEGALATSVGLQKQVQDLALNFKTLKAHFISLNKVVTNKLTAYSIQNSQTVYLKKLLFAQRLEQQTSKLMALLLSKKLDRVVQLRQFYTRNLKVSSFLCLHKISLREYFEAI